MSYLLFLFWLFLLWSAIAYVAYRDAKKEQSQHEKNS